METIKLEHGIEQTTLQLFKRDCKVTFERLGSKFMLHTIDGNEAHNVNIMEKHKLLKQMEGK